MLYGREYTNIRYTGDSINTSNSTSNPILTHRSSISLPFTGVSFNNKTEKKPRVMSDLQLPRWRFDSILGSSQCSLRFVFSVGRQTICQNRTRTFLWKRESSRERPARFPRHPRHRERHDVESISFVSFTMSYFVRTFYLHTPSLSCDSIYVILVAKGCSWSVFERSFTCTDLKRIELELCFFPFDFYTFK